MTGSELGSAVKKHPVGVAGGIVSLCCAVVLYIGAESLDEAKAKLDDVTKQSQTMLNNVRNAAGVSLSQQTSSLQQAAKQMESRLVKTSQLATNLQYFYRLESDTGIKLTDVRQNQAARGSPGGYIGVPYSVAFQGTLRQVLEFLQRIESGKHFSKYSSISFNKAAGQDTGGSTLSVSMNIELLGTP